MIRVGVEVRALSSHQSGPGLIPAPCQMWVKFVVGSCHALRVFLRVLQFSFLLKINISKFQFDQDSKPARKPADVG